MFFIRYTRNGGKWILITMGLFFLATLLILIPSFSLPLVLNSKLESSTNIGLSVLLAYKECLTLLNIFAVISIVLALIGIVLLIKNAIIKNDLPGFSGLLVIILFCFWGFGLGYIIQDSEVFEELQYVNEDIAQYESGDFEYVVKGVYPVGDTEELNGRLTSSLEQSEESKVFHTFKGKTIEDPATYDPYAEHDRGTSFRLPSDVEFDTTGIVPFDEYESIQGNYEKVTRLKIGSTSNYHIVVSVELAE